MRWVNDEKAKYYTAWATKDLFVEWTLISVWGGLGSCRGQARLTAVRSFEDSLSRIEEIAKRHWQHGYYKVEAA